MTEEYGLTPKKKKMLQRLKRIERLNGGVLTPERVLLDAAEANSPLHDQFTWNDDEAAHQYRLDQARKLIRSFKFEVVTHSRSYAVPVYTHAPKGDEKSGYRQTVNLRNTEEIAKLSLNDEIKRLRATCERCAGLAITLGLESYVLEIEILVNDLFRRLEGTGTDG